MAAEEEAHRAEEAAVSLLNVQVVRYNNLITTDSSLQMVAEEFVTLPHEDAIHEEEEAEPADDEDAADPGEGPSGAVEELGGEEY